MTVRILSDDHTRYSGGLFELVHSLGSRQR